MKIPLVLLLAALVSGCATYKSYSPQVNESARDITVQPRVLVAVFDGRADKDSNAPIQSLQAGIAKAYPSAVEIVDYFSPTPEGRIKVRIRVNEVGSQFGSRFAGAVAASQQFSQAHATATSGWNTVVAQAQGYSTGFSTAVAAEGWWVGTAYLEIQVEDRRQGRVDFKFPIIAEQRESNMMGYATAAAAAKTAWGKASVQLFSILDSIMLKARDR